MLQKRPCHGRPRQAEELPSRIKKTTEAQQQNQINGSGLDIGFGVGRKIAFIKVITGTIAKIFTWTVYKRLKGQ